MRKEYHAVGNLDMIKLLNYSEGSYQPEGNTLAYDRKCSMRPEPLDENEIALLERMQSWDSKKLGTKLPAWAKPTKHPAPFIFKAGQAAKFPVHVSPNKILPLTYTQFLCLDGPWEGQCLSLCDEFTGNLGFSEGHATLIFTVGNRTGRYVGSVAKGQHRSLIWEKH